MVTKTYFFVVNGAHVIWPPKGSFIWYLLDHLTHMN